MLQTLVCFNDRLSHAHEGIITMCADSLYVVTVKTEQAERCKAEEKFRLQSEQDKQEVTY